MGPKKKIIVFSIIFGTVSVALVCFVIYPLVKEIKNDSNEFIIVKRELVLSEVRARKFEQFKETYGKLEPDLEKIGQLFVDPGVPIDLIEFWEKTARDSELSISISPTSPRTAETAPWYSMGFQMNLTGSFPNFLKFLEKIERGSYLVEVKNLTVKRLTDENVSITLATKVLTE